MKRKALGVIAGLALLSVPLPAGDERAGSGVLVGSSVFSGLMTWARTVWGPFLSVLDLPPPQAPAFQTPELPTLYEVRMASLDHLRTLADQTVTQDGVHRVPNLVPNRFPLDLASLPASERKRAFIQSLLPAIVHENAMLARDRKRLKKLMELPDSAIRADDRAWVSELLDHYRVPAGGLYVSEAARALISRVDEVPPSLVLAQAALESAWGTSRYCRLGNALFGVQSTNPREFGVAPAGGAASTQPRAKGYATLLESVRDYMRILNTHQAYSEFRRLRYDQRRSGRGLDPNALAETLVLYSERGDAYVADVKNMIQQNRMRRYDRAEFRPVGLDVLAQYEVLEFTSPTARSIDLAWLADGGREASRSEAAGRTP